MNLETAFNYIFDGDAILFAGSGFSYGAKNIKNESLSVGDGLRDVIAEDCGISSTRPLSVVSQYHIQQYKSATKLINLLKERFTISSIEQWHKDILSVCWKRIYSTNYDSVVELAAKLNSKSISPVVLSNSISNSNIDNVCIHLNGYIDNLDENTLFNEFKLIDTSYSCDDLIGNEWFELFSSDLETAKAIVVIGYSMQYDIDFKRLLASPRIREKVIFVDKPNPDPIDESILRNYGDCEFIGVEIFANKLIEAKNAYTPPILHEYKSFIYEYRKTLTPSNISFDQLNDFYVQGKYIDDLSQKQHGEYKYMLLRNKVNEIEKNYYNTKAYLVLSDLGNGKTVFCNLVRNEFRGHDVNVYTFTHEYNDCSSEIDRITKDKSRHSIIIIDNYKSNLKILEMFKYRNKDRITFVITSRKSVNPSYRVLIDKLGVLETDIKPLYIDKLDDNEIKQFSNVIDSNKMYSSKMTDTSVSGIQDYLINECNSNFADILLEMYNSSDIKMRIFNAWKSFDISKVDVKSLVILALMKSVMGIDFDFTEMLNLLKIDYVTLSAKEDAFINEFFSITDNDVRIKSAVVSRELLSSVIGISDLLDTMQIVIKAADERYRVNRSCYELLKNLISHSHFRIFDRNVTNQQKISAFYDSIRNLTFCKDNTFFWEQFASACIETRHFKEATQCIENAFAIAKRIPSFVPFHVENIKANCMIEEILFNSLNNEKYIADEAIEIICDAHKRLIKYFSHPDNNISYVFRVGSKYVRVYELYENDFDKRHRSIFAEKCVEMIKLMKKHVSDLEFQNGHLSSWLESLEDCVYRCVNKE